VRVGRLWVGPPWETPPDDAVTIVVDPGRAFGTGAHPTTRLCLELLSGLEPAGIADLGCGSGVLAIAAARLGFEPVIAVDVDPAAVEAATANAAANGTAFDVRELDLARDSLPETPIAVANISLELVETVLSRVRSRIVIASGYLERERPSSGRYRFHERRVLEGWAADLLERAQ
jgi:ribosomal protein L11 methyltransferase